MLLLLLPLSLPSPPRCQQERGGAASADLLPAFVSVVAGTTAAAEAKNGTLHLPVAPLPYEVHLRRPEQLGTVTAGSCSCCRPGGCPAASAAAGPPRRIIAAAAAAANSTTTATINVGNHYYCRFYSPPPPPSIFACGLSRSKLEEPAAPLGVGARSPRVQQLRRMLLS